MYYKETVFIEQNKIEYLCKEYNIQIHNIEARSRSLLNRNEKGEYKFVHKSILEFFLAKKAFTDIEFRKIITIKGFVGYDMVQYFLKEMSTVYLNEVKLRTENNKLESISFKYLQLSGVDFYYKNIICCDFEGCNLSEACFSHYNFRTEFSRVKFNNANLQRADFYHTTLKKANLSGADLRGADLSYADLNGANLTRTKLNGSNLSGADLKGADLRGADLRGADLSYVKLYEANLNNTNLRDVDLKGANLKEVNLSANDLRGANLRGADLRGTDLNTVNLREVNLIRADLRGADLRNGDLVYADLRDADLRGADLFLINLHGANLTGAIFDEIQILDLDIQHYMLKGVKLYIEKTDVFIDYEEYNKRIK